MQDTATSDAAPSSSPKGTPKILYVMGAGRSGSTILGVALGNCDGIFYAGELDKWLPRAGVPELDDPERIRFWGKVRDHVGDGEGLFNHAAHRCLERSSALFRMRDWRHRRRLRPRYRRVCEDLYRTIATQTGSECIVDSSHYPLRARELKALTGVELYLLFLVRDPQSIVASLNRRDVAERRFDVPTANAYLWLTYLLSLVVFLRHRRDRRLLVSHEDFVSSPEAVLARILKLVASPAATPDLANLATGVAFQGNRLLGSRSLALRDRPERHVRASRLTAVLQSPWVLLFSRMRTISRREDPMKQTVSESTT